MGLFKKKQKNEDIAVGTDVSNDVVAPPAPPAENVAEAGTEPAAAELAQVSTTATQDIVYPEGVKLFALLSSVFVSMFLVALDRLIISTAIPQITDDFHSVTDIGWYGSAYMLTNCGFQLLYGKLYTFFSVKYTFLSAILLFEAGSALCGAAPTSDAFIVGRAIAGLGSAGIMNGVIVTIVYSVPLHKRPLYQGLFGAVFGVSSIIGPLLGGAFTSNVSWRWCFYINLPFGGIATAIIAFVMNIPERETTKLPLKAKLSQLDSVGTTVLVPGVVCLLLALQWGGSQYAWSSWRLIVLLTVASVLLVAFVAVQILMPDTATVPPRIFVQRSILAGFFSTLCIGSQMMIFVYFLPLWFQAIKGVSAIQSGIRMLPMVLPMVIASIFVGVLTAKVGYYTPFMIFGSCVLAVGAGLLTTFQVDTDQAKWVGYQFLYGFAMGCTFQAPNLAAQTVLPTRDVPIGTSLMFFSQLLGGAIFISVGQNVLDSQLISRLAGLPGFNPALIENTGATEITAHLPASLKPIVLSAYNESLRKVYQVGLIMACLTILGAISMEWRSVKKNKKPKQDAVAAEEGKATGSDEEEGEPKNVDDRDGDNTDDRTMVDGASEKPAERKGADAAAAAPAEKEKEIAA